MKRNSILEEALDAWVDARQGFIAEVSNIPAQHFGFRPAPDVRDVTEMVHHILEVALMMVGELSRPDTNLRRKPFPQLVKMYAGDLYSVRKKSALLGLLRTTLRDGVRTIRNAGELHMMQLITRFDGEQGTRLAWFYHAVAQEMYHRGQLALYQRLLGIEPALTRRIRGA